MDIWFNFVKINGFTEVLYVFLVNNFIKVLISDNGKSFVIEEVLFKD